MYARGAEAGRGVELDYVPAWCAPSTSSRFALETFGAPIYVRREIVHNRYVVNELAEKGAIFVHEIDDVPDGQRVIYSAHGVSPAVRDQ
jgi:4-hydroxy-3-methylbut-2-enyl diphosphate reductase IspH